MTRIKEARFPVTVRDPRDNRGATTFNTDDKTLRVSEDAGDIVIQALASGKVDDTKGEVRVSVAQCLYRVHFPKAKPQLEAKAS